MIYMLFFASGANTSMTFSIWGTLDRSIFRVFLENLFYKNVYIWYITQIVMMFWLVVAFAPLPGYMYFVGLGKDIKNLFRLSGEISAEELQHLCQTTGITHLVYSTQFNGDDSVISSVYEKVYDSSTVKIYATGVTPLANHPLYQEELAQYGEGIKD